MDVLYVEECDSIDISLLFWCSTCEHVFTYISTGILMSRELCGRDTRLPAVITISSAAVSVSTIRTHLTAAAAFTATASIATSAASAIASSSTTACTTTTAHACGMPG